MKIFNTADDPTLQPQQIREWIYNGLDCCVTAEVLEALLPQLDNHTAGTYGFSRDLQGPVLEMRLRGVLVDAARVEEVIEEYHEQLDTLESQLEKIVGDGCGLYDFNWRSNRDLHVLFYDVLGIPPISRGGRPTVDREALEKLEVYFQATQIVKHLLLMRDLQKKIGVLRTEIDDDGRMRTSYNIAGTTTGRLSSSFSEFGTGTNLQNIEESLRSVFVADRGYKLAYLDAQQGESRVVGAIEWNLFGDGRYLDACESGDLHTTVAKLVWPRDVPWTGRNKDDRKLAEQPYYRHYDRRFMCKKIGHGTNYGGKPRTLANQAKVEIKLIEDFQPKYFQAFPAHLRWHEWTARELATSGHIITLTNRKRWFFGRRNDDATIREAIAYQGQALGDILNRGMLEVWRRRDCQLLMQIHDAVLIQYPEQREDEIIAKVREQLLHPIDLEAGRRLTIPYDVATGWNWGKYSERNPDGLKAYSPHDKRKRQTRQSILDRPIHNFHRKSRKSRFVSKMDRD